MFPEVDLPPPEHDADEIREAAERILAGDEFRDDRNLVQRFAEWLVDRLADLFGGVAGSGGPGIVGTLIQLSMLALALAVLFLAGRALVRAHRARVGLDDDEDLGVAVVLGVPADPAGLRESAEAAETAGDWRAALLARFRLVVAVLIADGVLSDTPGRTTGEYRREHAVARPEQTSTFGAATRAFEAAYYGHVDVGPLDVDDMRERSATLLGARVAAGAGR